jgi:hypothetical protein
MEPASLKLVVRACAMELLGGGCDSDVTKLLARWHSDAMIQQAHPACCVSQTRHPYYCIAVLRSETTIMLHVSEFYRN